MLDLLHSYCELIKDRVIRQQVVEIVNNPIVIAAYSAPSSSTGLYHPVDEFCQMGLLIHSLRVCCVALQLYNCYESYEDNPTAYDVLIASSLLHDVPYKFDSNGKCLLDHDHRNACFFQSISNNLDNDIRDEITKCILLHTGRWSNNSHSDFSSVEHSQISWVLHQADVIASRRNVLINYNCIDYLKNSLNIKGEN